MAKSPFEANPAFAKLTEDSRKSVTQAFDAMTSWREQMADMGERNSEAVFDKMAEAAKALGWPAEFVEMSRKQMSAATKMQTQIVNHVMDTWEQQMTSPGSPIKMPNFQAPGFEIPGFSAGSAASPFPGFGDMGGNPMQMWMQAAEMWQKNWQQAMSGWANTQSNVFGGGDKSSSKNTR